MKYYSAADVFVLASNCESFAIPVLEAMAAGLPVITTRVGFVGDAIVSGKNGFVVNENEIQNKINLLYKDKKLRKNMGDAARKTAKRYDWNIIVKEIENIYKVVKNA